MPWQAWILVAVFAFSILAKVYQVGRPRKPVEAWEACAAVVEFGFYGYLAYWLGTNV